MLCCHLAVIIMKNIKLILIAFIVGNLSGFIGYKTFFVHQADIAPPLNLKAQIITAPSSNVQTQIAVKHTSVTVKKALISEKTNTKSSLLSKATTPENTHMLHYLIKHKIIDKNDSLESARQQLLDNYQDTTHQFSIRLDNISMYSQLNDLQIPQDTIELLLTDLITLDESHDSDQIIQVINLLQNNIAEYQLPEISGYLNSDDPYIQASVIEAIGNADPYKDYQEQIFHLWKTSSFKHVREQAYFALTKQYNYNFSDHILD